MCGLPQGLENIRSPPYGELSLGRHRAALPCVGLPASHQPDWVNNNWTWGDDVIFVRIFLGVGYYLLNLWWKTTDDISIIYFSCESPQSYVSIYASVISQNQFILCGKKTFVNKFHSHGPYQNRSDSLIVSQGVKCLWLMGIRCYWYDWAALKRHNNDKEVFSFEFNNMPLSSCKLVIASPH